MEHSIDPEAVIARLSNQIGQLYAELAMRDVALDALQKQLEALQSPPDPPPATT